MVREFLIRDSLYILRGRIKIMFHWLALVSRWVLLVPLKLFSLQDFVLSPACVLRGTKVFKHLGDLEVNCL